MGKTMGRVSQTKWRGTEAIPATVQSNGLNFDINVELREEDYQGEDDEQQAAGEAMQQVPVTNEETRVEVSQEERQEDGTVNQENDMQTMELANEDEQGHCEPLHIPTGRGYYPRPRFVTAPVTRQSQKAREEAITIVTQVTPERRAVEKRRTLENREHLPLCAEFMDERNTTRRQPQTVEHNFLASFPTSEITTDLSMLHPDHFSSDENIEWIHGTEKIGGHYYRGGIPSISRGKTFAQALNGHSPHKVLR
ncbi:hypothetical protein R1sor_009037 [Riccia sorocarpa]|uniref:Uncharacterized protein n=1 Tax=Riccia sorocarpa TaxID=122646 RepID=A0ABD3H4M2_9MARC